MIFTVLSDGLMHVISFAALLTLFASVVGIAIWLCVARAISRL